MKEFEFRSRTCLLELGVLCRSLEEAREKEEDLASAVCTSRELMVRFGAEAAGAKCGTRNGTSHSPSGSANQRQQRCILDSSVTGTSACEECTVVTLPRCVAEMVNHVPGFTVCLVSQNCDPTQNHLQNVMCESMLGGFSHCFNHVQVRCGRNRHGHVQCGSARSGREASGSSAGGSKVPRGCPEGCRRAQRGVGAVEGCP